MCRSALMRRTARLTEVAACTVAALAVTISTAWAGSLQTAAPLTAHQGDTIIITGLVSPSNRCPTGTAVQLTSIPATGTTNLFPNGLGPIVPRSASGAFQASVTIGVATPVGSYAIGFVCNGESVMITQTLIVTAAPQPKPSITVSPASAAPGASITVSGVLPTSGAVFCPPGDATELTSTAALFPPNGLGPQVPRDTSGNFRANYTIPATTTAGTYSIGLRCGGGNAGVAGSLQVTAPAPTTTSAPSTTTTSSTSTTLAPVTTTAPTIASTLPPLHVTVRAKATASSSPLRWVALGVLLLVVLAAAALYARQRRAS
jgi:hypothetical protein